MTAKNTKVNNGLEAWRVLNVTYDSNITGRQQIQMQCFLQRKRPESIAQTTEAVEIWDRDVREYEQRFGKVLDEDVKIGVIFAVAPSPLQNHCRLNSHTLKSYGQVRTKLFDYCLAQTHLVCGGVEPMNLSMLGKGKGKKGKGDRPGNGQGKGKKGESNKREKGKDKDRNGKGESQGKATKHFDGYCFYCKEWGHMKKDCWWNEGVKHGRETSPLEASTLQAPRVSHSPMMQRLRCLTLHSGCVR